jgi:hypothetical protein
MLESCLSSQLITLGPSFLTNLVKHRWLPANISQHLSKFCHCLPSLSMFGKHSLVLFSAKPNKILVCIVGLKHQQIYWPTYNSAKGSMLTTNCQKKRFYFHPTWIFKGLKEMFWIQCNSHFLFSWKHFY